MQVNDSPHPRLHPWMLLTVLVWGINFVGIKFLYQQMSAPALALTRALPMYLVLVLYCSLSGMSLRYPKSKETLGILGLGVLSMGIYMIFFLEGLRYLRAAEGAILMATAPIWTAIFSALFCQEPFRWKVMVGAGISFLGVGLLVGVSGSGSHHVDLRGVGLELVAAACWAMSVVVSKPLLKNRTPVQLLTMSIPGGIVALLPYSLVASLQVPWSQFHAVTWISFIHISLFAGAVGFLGFYKAVQDIGPVGAMLHQFLVPPTALVFSILLLNESASLNQIAGMVLVFVGVYSSQRARMMAQAVVAS